MVKLSRLGFSLIEMSIVLVIVGILAVGALSIASIQIEAANVTQTNAKLDKIERAIQLFFEVNGYLPCPASGNLPKSDPAFGISQGGGGGNCTSGINNSGLRNGVVPSRTLNLSDNTAIDGWGQRITYVVHNDCVLTTGWPATPTNYTDDCSTADISIIDNNIPFNNKNNTSVYVLISHGKNKNGAWGNNGGTARIAGNNPLGGANELENSDFNEETFSEDSLNDTQGMTLPYFDDLVRWKTGAQIQYEKNN